MDAVDVDFSMLPEVLTEVREHLAELERDLHKLVQSPASNDLLSSAFRHMHTIKGDFGYCHAEPIMDFVHHLEGVLQTLRERRYPCSALVAEALIQGMDQIQSMMETLAATHAFDATPREVLIERIRLLAQARNQDDADQCARHVLLALHESGMPTLQQAAASPAGIARAQSVGAQLQAALVLRNPALEGRLALQMELVLQLNAQYLRPSNSEALRLAVLWHDVGLLALPDSLQVSAPLPGNAEWSSYATHPELAARWLLATAPDCTEAAQIVRQHHLGVNGRGIPAPGDALPPHPGALMLASADLLWEHVAGLSGEDFRRGILRTLFEVNGGLETRFDPSLINAFDAVARKMTAREP